MLLRIQVFQKCISILVQAFWNEKGGKNVGKCMELITSTFGAHSADGRKRVCDSNNKQFPVILLRTTRTNKVEWNGYAVRVVESAHNVITQREKETWINPQPVIWNNQKVLNHTFFIFMFNFITGWYSKKKMAKSITKNPCWVKWIALKQGLG